MGKARNGKPKNKAAKRRQPASWRYWLPSWTALASAGLMLLIVGSIGLVVLVKGLPDIRDLNKASRQPGIQIFSSDGTQIGSYGQIYGEFVRFGDLPKTLVAAVLATEDRRFFKHEGIDYQGILRAFVANIKAGHVVEGGSTITQQVAKNVFLTNERTYLRKLQEAMLAVWLENRYSKEEILAIYLNRVYLGAGTYGVDAASRRYFDKPVTDINLHEAALLAGLLKAPSRYAPTTDAERAQARARQVLINMHDAKVIDAASMGKAIEDLPKALVFDSGQDNVARYFADWIAAELPNYVGQLTQDVKVYTTLDLKMQELAAKAVSETMAREAEGRNATQAAFVAMEPGGAIRALVGGRDYKESQFNRVTQAKRQPGSAFKTFVYLAAFERGYTPYQSIVDRPINIGGWSPKNYSGEYAGTVRLRDAYARSLNTAAVQLSEAVGRGNVALAAERMGIQTPLPRAQASLALGTTEVTLLELVSAYAPLAGNGMQAEPYGVDKITGVSGAVLYQRFDSGRARLLGDDALAKMRDVMMMTMEQGTGRGAAIGRPAGGKTGTSQDFRDAWFIGYTPQLVAGAWVGNDNNAPMKDVTGGTIPAHIWRAFMKPALAGERVTHMARYSPGFWENLWDDGPSEPSVASNEGSGSWFSSGDVEYDYPDPNRRRRGPSVQVWRGGDHASERVPLNSGYEYNAGLPAAAPPSRPADVPPGMPEGYVPSAPAR